MKNNTWLQKSEEAMIFVKEINQNELETIQKIEQTLKDLEQELQNQTIFLNNMYFKKDQNAISFFPIDEEEYQIEKKVEEEISKLNVKILSLKEEYTKLSQNKKKYTVIYECLEKLNSDYKEKSLNNEKKNTSLSFIESQEIERKRIARDLHDSTIQSLTMLVHKTDLVAKLFDIDVVRAKLELMSMTKNIRDIINELRAILYNLQPMSLTDLGFVETIQQYSDFLIQGGKVKVFFQAEEKHKNVSDLVYLSLYRIIQEACSNTVKHGKAKNIYIHYICENEKIQLKIKDDGDGFESKNTFPNQGCGYGLKIMQERVLMMSGIFQIESVIGKGTTIKIQIPLK